MANEAQISCAVNFSKGGVKVALSIASTSITVTGTNAISATQTFSTSNTQLVTTGGITGSQIQGYLLIVNNDTTNDLLISRSATHAAGSEVSRVLPGKFTLIAVNNTVTACSYYAKSSAATVLTQVVLFEQ